MRRRSRPLEDDRPSGDPVAVAEAPTGLVDRRETPATEGRARDNDRERENTEAHGAEKREGHTGDHAEHKHEPPTARRRRETGRGRRKQDVERTPLYGCAHASGR